MEVNGAKQLFGSNRSSTYLPLCSFKEMNPFIQQGHIQLIKSEGKDILLHFYFK